MKMQFFRPLEINKNGLRVPVAVKPFAIRLQSTVFLVPHFFSLPSSFFFHEAFSVG